jgi:hypothetical protein
LSVTHGLSGQFKTFSKFICLTLYHFFKSLHQFLLKIKKIND